MFKKIFAQLTIWMSGTWDNYVDEMGTGTYFDYNGTFGEYIYLDEYGF